MHGGYNQIAVYTGSKAVNMIYFILAGMSNAWLKKLWHSKLM